MHVNCMLISADAKRGRQYSRMRHSARHLQLTTPLCALPHIGTNGSSSHSREQLCSPHDRDNYLRQLSTSHEEAVCTTKRFQVASPLPSPMQSHLHACSHHRVKNRCPHHRAEGTHQPVVGALLELAHSPLHEWDQRTPSLT
jgi:hypothetical protein